MNITHIRTIGLAAVFGSLGASIIAIGLLIEKLDQLHSSLADAEALIRRNEHRMEQLAEVSAALSVDGATLTIEGDGARLRWELVVPDVSRASGTAASLMEMLDRPAEVAARRAREASAP